MFCPEERGPETFANTSESLHSSATKMADWKFLRNVGIY
jgi:hypothetical protein